MVEELRFPCLIIIFFFFFLHFNFLWFLTVTGSSITSALSRHDFPPDFLFGAGTSAYQIEGAVAEDGRKPNIWDSYIHGGNIDGVANADIAADQYHKYKDDVKLMYDMGLDAYRLSFSWSRILPDGQGDINQKGLNYYNNLINELVSCGIEPHVTLSHFDLPQALQDEYGGLISPKIIEDFTAYADVCFREFGDRVKYWTTFNEPNIQTIGGNDIGTIPPARCSYPFGAVNCTEGDSTTEPYASAHYILLSHAAAVNLYKEKYQEKQRGRIGITILVFWFKPMTDSPRDITATQRSITFHLGWFYNMQEKQRGRIGITILVFWFKPMTDSPRDIAATQRSITFHLGWFLDPLVYGNYPALMRKIVGSRLPVFTESESKQLRGSFDFIGLNHYCVVYIQDLPTTPDKYGSDYLLDVSSIWAFSNGKSADFIRVKAPRMPVASWGLQKALEYVKLKYKNPAVMIHENGYADTVSSPAHTNDTARIEYIQAYIKSVLLSIRNGSTVRGYFVWSFMDCFEWLTGYTARFGLYGVDFNDKDLKRFPRLSAHWYTSFLAKGGRKTETSAYLYNA